MGDNYGDEGGPPQSTPDSPDGKLEFQPLTVIARARFQPLPFFSFAFLEPASKGLRSGHLILLLYLVFDCG